MNKDKPYIAKRIIAYIIDMFIIALISTLLLVNFVADDETYFENSDKFTNLVNELNDKKIDQKEYDKRYNELNYEITKSTTDVTIIMSGVALLYYVIFCYCRNGQTLGKQIMRIRLVSNNGKKLHINNYLIRSLLINQILLNIVDSVMIIFLSKNTYITWYNNFNTVFSGFLIISLLFMFYRNDGRGLHDIVANTKVVNVKRKVEEVNEVSEAIYEGTPNIIQVDSNDTKEQKEKEDNKKNKRKNKKISENPEGVSESERI